MKDNIVYNDERSENTSDDYCDLDPTKLCNSCCKCLDDAENGDYRSLNLSEFLQKQEMKAYGVRKRRQTEKSSNE